LSLAVLPDSCALDPTILSNTFDSNEAGNVGFPRSARLLSAGDYGTVFKRNQRFGDRYWTLLVHRSNDSPARLGLAIAKKRAKRAVDRNKLKRIAREAFRIKRLQLYGVDLVVMNRDAAASTDNSTLRLAFDKLLDKIEKSSAT
jgi:ribonuclease P protein component